VILLAGVMGFIAGMALAFILGWFFWRVKQQQALALLSIEQTHTRQELHKLEEALSVARSTEELLRMEHNELSISNTRLQTLLEESEKTETLQVQTFERLGQQVLKSLQADIEEKQAKEYQQRQHLMDEKLSQVVKPLKEVIEHHEKRVREIEKQHTTDTASLKKHIELIVEETGRLVQVKDRLAEALSNSKGRGDWGELELIRLLELSGLIEGVHFDSQKTQQGLRPDITVHLPNGRVIYIDAKTILVNLERLFRANTVEEEQKERKKHADLLEKEILSLNVKAYAKLSQDSIDFVVLYVPRESMLRAALEEKPALMEQAFQKKVLLASPLILMSVLKTVGYGWDQARLSQNAQEIHQLGLELHRRAALFFTKYEKMGERLEQLNLQYEETKRSLTGRQGMLPQLKKIEQFGCKSEKQLTSASLFPEEPPDDSVDQAFFSDTLSEV
jgi:DNA recombination protein RmuC